MMASSAGTIIYSTLLTKFAVTRHYLVHPGVLRNEIITQQSTWMEISLEDGGGAVVVLGGGIGSRHWEMALGGI